MADQREAVCESSRLESASTVWTIPQLLSGGVS